MYEESEGSCCDVGVCIFYEGRDGSLNLRKVLGVDQAVILFGLSVGAGVFRGVLRGVG